MNNLKRIVPLLSALVILVSCLVYPVSASSFETEEVLYDYFSYSNASPYHTVYPDTNTVVFELPQRQYVRYVDLVIASGQTINSVSCKRGTVTAGLTLSPIGNGYYRLYGALSGGKAAWGDSITFIFDVTSSGADIQFIKFNYSIMAIDYWDEIMGIYVQPSSYSSTIYMSDADTPLTVYLENQSELPIDYYGWIYPQNWKNYDYMDILISVESAGLSSLSCHIGEKAVPFSVSLYDSGFGQVDHVEWDYDSVTDSYLYYFDYSTTYSWVQIHLDLTNIRRTLTDSISITFTGRLSPGDGQNIRLVDCCGYVAPNNQNQLAILFGDLKDFLSELFAPDSDTQIQIDEGVNSADFSNSQIDSTIDSLEDPDSVDIDIIIQESEADPSFISSFFAVFLNNIIIMRVFWLAALFMIIGYIFHGQR